MSLTAKELQQIKGLGNVLANRLLDSGHDSFARIVKLGESGLRQVQGINQKAVPDIIEQATRLAATDNRDRNTKIAELKESLQGLRQSVQELTTTARDRFSEKLAGKTGRKLTDALVRFLSALEDIEEKTGKKLKRTGKVVVKAEQHLEGLAEAGLKELRKGLKRARKALQRVNA
jgi:cell division septum initiation protein DivIVA